VPRFGTRYHFPVLCAISEAVMSGACIAVLGICCACAAATSASRPDAAAEEELINSAVQTGQQQNILDRVKGDLTSILDNGDGSAQSAHLLSAIGVFCVSVGEIDCAVKALEQAKLIGESRFGAEHPFTINILVDLGAAYRRANRNIDALHILDRALEATRTLYGASNIHEADILVNRSSAYLAAGDAKSALQDADLAIADLGGGDSHTKLRAASLANKSIALSKLGRASDGIDTINEAESVAKGGGGPYPLLIPEILTAKGIVESDAGNTSAAGQAFSQARQMYATALGPLNERSVQVGLLQSRQDSKVARLGLGQPGGGSKIGVSIGSLEDKFSGDIGNGIVHHAEALPGVSVQIEDASDDASKQLSQVQKFIATGVDALIVTPVNTSATTAITKAAAEAGVPLVYVNREPADVDNLGPKVAFVASNEAESGTLEAKEICRLLGGKGNILVMQGRLSNRTAV
jgi:tetratricopeptide (TPR) repeat protein